MNPPTPKGQHTVSKMLLKRFTNEDGKLFFFVKAFPEKGVLVTTPEKLFRQTHIYTARREDGTLDVSLENYYARLESLAEPIVEKIVTSARAGERPHLTPDERQIWDLFFLNQWKRVPDFHETIVVPEDIETRIKRLSADFEANIRPLNSAEESNLRDPQSRERIMRNAMIHALARPSPRILTVLKKKGLVIAVIRKPNKSLAIGSFPVVKLTFPGRENLEDPSVEAWLPIAHDVAVSPAPIPPQEEALCPMQDDSMIRRLNVATCNKSSTIAGKSKLLIASLSQSR
ncbi:MAG: DUF4238 domain-containing protein [Candidatus Acidiferrales bacterium]